MHTTNFNFNFPGPKKQSLQSLDDNCMSAVHVHEQFWSQSMPLLPQQASVICTPMVLGVHGFWHVKSMPTRESIPFFNESATRFILNPF